jgi:DNA-binding response OmpR family regulator
MPPRKSIYYWKSWRISKYRPLTAVRGVLRSGNRRQRMENAQRVLVVEDDRVLREMLHRGLVQNGFSCTCAASAEEARAALPGGRFDVMLTDVNMAGMSGLELARWARAHHPEVPVLVMSGSGNPHVRDDAGEAGAASFIDKPFTMQHLVSSLRAVASHGPATALHIPALTPPRMV